MTRQFPALAKLDHGAAQGLGRDAEIVGEINLAEGQADPASATAGDALAHPRDECAKLFGRRRLPAPDLDALTVVLRACLEEFQ